MRLVLHDIAALRTIANVKFVTFSITNPASDTINELSQVISYPIRGFHGFPQPYQVHDNLKNITPIIIQTEDSNGAQHKNEQTI
jgi:hypothetical protein